MRLVFVITFIGTVIATLSGCSTSGADPTLSDMPDDHPGWTSTQAALSEADWQFQNNYDPDDDVDADMRIEPTAIVTGDVNCADFATRGEAQDFFDTHGGPTFDPYHLDGDNDGRACELNY